MKFDVIVVDQFMEKVGGVMVGTDVLFAMRRMRFESVIIGCSGNDMEEQFSNETNDLLAAAFNITEVDEIENGDISSAETHHYRERLKDIQDEGVEGNIRYIHFTLLKFPLDKFHNFYY